MSWKDCDCGMARIRAEIERCSTCEIAAHTRELDEALAEVERLLGRAGESEGGDVSKPKWSSSFYAGAAEAARREADEAAKFDFRARAAQLAMAARDIAALESINAELVEVLAECVDRIDTFYGPPGSNHIDRELIARARAVLAKARGEYKEDME